MLVTVSLHTDAQLSNWSEGWMERFDEQFDGRGADPATLEVLWVEADDMRARHPCRRIIDTWTSSCTPAPAVHRGMGSNVEQWRPLVQTYFDGGTETMLCLIRYESGGNPTARNPRSSATGLTQILYSTWGPHFGLTDRSQLEDPETNIRLAKAIYDIQGWRAWSPYKRGLCRG